MFYSQFGEDKILSEIFSGKSSGVCIEVGANDGINDSNTLYFEKIGWSCVLVEPNPVLCQMIRVVRNASLYECAASDKHGVATFYIAEGAERAHAVSMICELNAKEEAQNKIKSYGFTCQSVQVNTRTLDEILVEQNFNRGIDFISIDVEGHEREVLGGFSIERWTPIVIIIEDNSNFKDAAISNYLKKFGYVRFLRTGVNDWYAQRTNKRLVNIGSKIRIIWTVLKIRVKNRLRKIPLILKLRSFLRMQGVR